MRRFVRVLLRMAFVAAVVAALVIGGGFAWTIEHYGHNLPDFRRLDSYEPALGSKIYAGDGSLLAEYAAQRRIFVPFSAIPRRVVDAFLAAEDREFYHHNGVNPLSIVRAALADILRVERGERPIGASTITQQLVRHFLLTDRVSLGRKIKEAILAYRIEHYLSKDRILEIYLNEIYLGAGAYGVGEAAETYFNKPLDQLTLAEAAFLAALPKAPNNYNPLRNPQAAKDRRDWVLAGMAGMGWVGEAEARQAMTEPVDAQPQSPTPAEDQRGGYFAEEVRRELVARFGEKRVYEGGLTVRTSYVPQYQEMAKRAFRDGLIAYDRRHGWRGPVAHLSDGYAAEAALSTMADPPGIGDWQLAAVVSVDAAGARIALRDGSAGFIPLDGLRWARRTLADQQVGAPVRTARDVLSAGDIVPVAPLSGSADAGYGRRRGAAAGPFYGLRQIPNVSGGVVVMDPRTGRIFALVGGWDFRASQFDRAVQAMRQPGSSIKPFVYVTALENGFTPASTIDDAPIALPQGPGLPMWRPDNYEAGYVGPTTLWDALVHSRNMATARLASEIGIRTVGHTVDAFGIMDKMPPYYSMALGAGDTTLMRLTSAYAMLDDGGTRLVPSLIDTVQDRDGRIVYQKGVAGCPTCFIEAGSGTAPDAVPNYRPAGPPSPSQAFVPNAPFAPNAALYEPLQPGQLVDPIADAQIISMMQGVIQHGTGIKVAGLGKPLAGKTGTTSNWFDGWFIGFSPDLVAGVYVGFDEPRTLGTGEAGGNVAAPIFRDFMAQALANAPAVPFPIPAGADLVTVDAKSGRPASSDDPNAIVVPFRPGTAPTVASGPPEGMLTSDDQDEQPGQGYGPEQGDEPGQGDAPGTSPAGGAPMAVVPASGTGGLY